MPRTNKRFAASPRLIAGAGLYAAAEIAAGLLLGRFFAWGRAEALLFLAFRPWLLLAAAALVAKRRWQARAAYYAGALLLAAASETLLLTMLGASHPWPEALRGLAAGALLAIVLDLLVQGGRRLNRRFGRSLGVAAALLLFLLAGALRPYERIALGPAAAEGEGERPSLHLMTALPIVWGEAGPFAPESRPAEFYRLLGREYDVRPLDHLDAETLGGGAPLLLAQPRALAPEELVALDAWVRSGGRVLILADPRLGWPSALPLGDIRRPPPASLLAPLFRHWGMRLGQGEGPPLRTLRVRAGGEPRRLALAAPGRFTAEGEACRAIADGLAARCRIGAGEALLVADADLVRDELWLLPGGAGGDRHFRIADNPLIVFDLLDRLAGIERERAAPAVEWVDPGAARGRAVAVAALPPLLAAGLGLILARRRRRRG